MTTICGSTSWRRGFCRLCFGITLSYTLSGQLIDWIGTHMIGWGMVGTVLFGLSGAPCGLNCGAGSPLPFLIVSGYLYPRLEILTVIVAPALVIQTDVLVRSVRRDLR